MWKIFMIQGWRNLKRNARRTAVTVAVITIGLTMMIFSYGLIQGFIPQMVEGSARTLNGHILIHKSGYFHKKSLEQALKDPQKIEELLSQDTRVESWSKRLIARGLLGSAEGVQGIKMLGADPEQDKKLINLYKKIVKGRAPRAASGESATSSSVSEVMLGRKIAKKLKVEVGSKVILKLGRFGGSAIDEPMRVSGIFATGSPGFDSFYIVLHYKDAARILKAKGRAHQFAIRVKNLEHVEAVTASLKRKFKGKEKIEILSWTQFAPEVKAMVKMSSVSIGLILFLIFPIVLLGCLNTMLMSAHERTREVGIMKAVGTSPWQIIQLFFWEGVFLSLLGAAVGIVLGLSLSLYFESIGGVSTKFLMQDQDVKVMVSGIALDAVMMLKTTVQGVIIPTVTVVLSTIMASLYPAWKASQLKPTKAIQFH